MGNRCAICTHPKRAEIDAALVGATVPFRTIGAAYGMSHTSAIRHAAAHIPALLAEAHEAEVVADATTLLERVEELAGMARTWHDEASELLRDAKALPELADDEQIAAAKRDPVRIKNRAAAIQVGTRSVRTIGGVLDLLGRVTGELRDRQVNVNVLVASPEWIALRGRMLDALAPYPEARAALIAALEERT